MLRLRLTFAALVLAALLGSITSSKAQSPWGEGYLPNVPVISQNGEIFKFYEDLVKEKTVVISFIFTSCRDICPIVTARLAQVQDILGDKVGREIFFLSISVDPVVDTPEKLRDYASAFGVGSGWTFLTGKPEDMHLIRNKLGERIRGLSDHSNTLLLYNDRTSEWSKDSPFSDINSIAINIKSMNPDSVRVHDEQARSAPSASASLNSVTDLSTAAGLPGQHLFIKTCAACHTVGRGNKIGPDLLDISSRRPKDWIVRYLVDPQKMRAEGDPAALDLAARYPAVRMPTLSLSENDAADLTSYIAALSYGARADQQVGHAHSGHDHH